MQPIPQANSVQKPYVIKQGQTKVAPYDSICAPNNTWICMPAN